MYASTTLRAKQVQAIVDEHYEEGRHDRCKLWVYRTYIRKQMGISQQTFFRCLRRAKDAVNDKHEENHQYTLQF